MKEMDAKLGLTPHGALANPLTSLCGFGELLVNGIVGPAW
jgi:hypothetical protein